MRHPLFYRRDNDDKTNSANRCRSEAERGRIALALERLHDLRDEFPDDPTLIYCQGILLREHLGRGLESRSLFEHAFHGAQPKDPVRGMAACNVAALAGTLDEFGDWTARARQLLPDDQGVKQMCDVLAEAGRRSGFDYHAYLANHAAMNGKAGEPGNAAAILEVSLAGGHFRASDEVAIRRARACWLRELDAKAERIRDSAAEGFPPAERLALHDALAEIERAIALDEFDPEQWNLRAAWCLLLGRNQEALDSAKKSVALRPHGYIKPWLNQAIALQRLGCHDEARECAREVIRHARSPEDGTDRKAAERILASTDRDNGHLGEQRIGEWLTAFMGTSSTASREEIASGGWTGTYDDLAAGFLKKTRGFGDRWDPEYLRIMTQALTFFTPQTVLIALHHAGAKREAVYNHAVYALLFITCHSTGVMQRDAARAVCLFLLGAVRLTEIRTMYRRIVLDVSTAAEDFRALDRIIREDLDHIAPRWINPRLSALIADQPPVDAAGRARAWREILWRFKPDQMGA